MGELIKEETWIIVEEYAVSSNWSGWIFKCDNCNSMSSDQVSRINTCTKFMVSLKASLDYITDPLTVLGIKILYLKSSKNIVFCYSLSFWWWSSHSFDFYLIYQIFRFSMSDTLLEYLCVCNLSKEYCRPSPHSNESFLSSSCGDHLDLTVLAGSPSGQGASLQSSPWAARGQKGSRCHAKTCPGISTSEFLPLKPTPPPTRGANCRRQTVRCPPHSRSGWTGTPWSSRSPRSAVSLSCRQEHF